MRGEEKEEEAQYSIIYWMELPKGGNENE